MKQAVRELVIGTRGSKLALWQAEWVHARLHELEPGLPVSLKRIKTTGDKILDTPLAAIGGKGLFVKEIEDALLRGEIDLAVHSMKDVPTHLPAGLAILSMPEREDPRDALISRDGATLARLKTGARIGTSSLRRQAQLLNVRPDLSIHILRGNLDTRLRKLEAGEYDGIILAAAGLRRLGWTDRITEYLAPDVCLPAIGQGALALEGRSDDTFVRDVAARLEHRPTRIAVTAERALLERLEGGCQVPIAAHATILGESLSMTALVAGVNGRRLVRDSIQGSVTEAHSLGIRLAERLLERGGDEILKEIYGTAP
ncbi:MAG: hydroxymethylbilane synthase [Nitrospirae bacterium]|nr:MAG: hydroxymethylbilane synthase [Nitrospirota bacterium]